MKKTIYQYAIAIILIAIAIFIVFEEDYFIVVQNVSLFHVLATAAISLLCLSVSGFIVALITSKQYRIKLKLIDIVTLPLMMYFWGIMIPIKGGMLYQVFFLKSKYNLKIVQGVSIAIYRYLIVFIVAGVFGLFYAVSHNQILSPLTFISLFLIFSLYILKLTNRIFQNFSFRKWTILQKVQRVIQSLTDSVQLHLWDFKMTASVSALSLLQIFCRVLRYYWICHIFKIDVSFLLLTVLTLFVEITNIFRFVPGNIGVTELVTGGLLNVLGKTTAEGVLIALFVRASVLILVFTFGVGAVLVNMKYFHLKSIKNLFFKLKQNVPSS